MDGHLFATPGPTRFPRILIAENHLPTFESLVSTITDRSLDVDVDFCTSHRGAVRKLLASPYQLIISGARLADIEDCLLVKRSQALEPSVPLVITARGGVSDKASARRVLMQGAFDLITNPLDHEQTVNTIRLALWHNRFTTLIARKEQTLEKYRQHLADYPAEKRMEEAFARTLAALLESIHSYERTILRIEESTVCFSDFATKLAHHARTRALERLEALGNNCAHGDCHERF